MSGRREPKAFRREDIENEIAKIPFQLLRLAGVALLAADTGARTLTGKWGERDGTDSGSLRCWQAFLACVRRRNETAFPFSTFPESRFTTVKYSIRNNLNVAMTNIRKDFRIISRRRKVSTYG